VDKPRLLAMPAGGTLDGDKVMKRHEVLSLLERFPELVDGDDDLLNELITDSKPERADMDAMRPDRTSKNESDERPAKHPR
jgi:hypothetical protein